MTDPLLEVEELHRYFWEDDSIVDRILLNDPVAVRAVDGVSFEIHRGETLGLVGESGCGKSTVGETILRLQAADDGTVRFNGESIFDLSREALRSFRRQAQIVFQDPTSSLDPRMTVGQIVREPLDIHGIDTPNERADRVRHLLERVGLSADQFDRYPNEFSGGQQQRIAIARALALEPDFIVLDEPTSALDVSVQAQVLNLLRDLQEEFGLTYLLISHDLSIIRQVCDRVAVMYLGELVEIAPVEELFESPKHPYTKALLESVPRAEVGEQTRARRSLKGDVPSPRDPPSGCRFRTRCTEVIPPEGLGIEQEAYRAIMTARQRIEARTVGVDSALTRIGVDSVDDLDAAGRDALVGDLLDHLIDIDLPDRHRRHVEEALSLVVEGEEEAAAAGLSERYASPCERHHPHLLGNQHLVACHLHHPPTDRASETGA